MRLTWASHRHTLRRSTLFWGICEQPGAGRPQAVVGHEHIISVIGRKQYVLSFVLVPLWCRLGDSFGLEVMDLTTNGIEDVSDFPARSYVPLVLVLSFPSSSFQSLSSSCPSGAAADTGIFRYQGQTAELHSCGWNADKLGGLTGGKFWRAVAAAGDVAREMMRNAIAPTQRYVRGACGYFMETSMMPRTTSGCGKGIALPESCDNVPDTPSHIVHNVCRDL
jgi:hypothetical protein